MTDEQLIGMAKGRGIHDAEGAVFFGRAIEAAAVAAERERCAKLCEDYAVLSGFEDDEGSDHEGAAYHLATEIRKRSDDLASKNMATAIDTRGTKVRDELDTFETWGRGY